MHLDPLLPEAGHSSFRQPAVVQCSLDDASAGHPPISPMTACGSVDLRRGDAQADEVPPPSTGALPLFPVVHAHPPPVMGVVKLPYFCACRSEGWLAESATVGARRRWHFCVPSVARSHEPDTTRRKPRPAMGPAEPRATALWDSGWLMTLVRSRPAWATKTPSAAGLADRPQYPRTRARPEAAFCCIFLLTPRAPALQWLPLR